MEHFTKGSSEADEDEKQKWDIQVKGGSKMRNVISHALRLLKKEEKIILTGTGPTVTRAITCAEIVKRKVKNLHQNNKLSYLRTVDIWEPKEDQQLDSYQAPGLSRSPVQFGKEELALAIEEEDNNRKSKGSKERKFTDGRKGHASPQRAASKVGSSPTQMKGSHSKTSHKLDGVKEGSTEETGSRAKDSEQLAGPAGANTNKRGCHHGSYKRRQSQNKKQKRSTHTEQRTQAANPPKGPTE